MKILVAGPAGQRGGLEIHTSELIRFLRKQDHQVVHIEITEHANHRRKLRVRFGKLIQWLKAFSLARFFSPDLLISTATGSGYRWLSKVSGPSCFRVVQVVTEDYPSNDTRMLRIVNSHDAVAAQTSILKRQVHMKLSETIPCQVLPCFHQIHRSHLPTHSPAPPLDKGIRLAFFGRLAGNKGIPELFQVWQQLGLSSLYTLDIWGSGPLNVELEEILTSSPQLKRVIFFKGPYPGGEEYTKLLSRYHGLVLPSQATEGLPLVLLEAASIGLPILTTSIGGIPDFATDNPDVFMVGLGVDSLRYGLVQFIHLIQTRQFDRDRHRELFSDMYSLPVIEAQWRSMLVNPRYFFQGSTYWSP